jgi:hypothetical protein
MKFASRFTLPAIALAGCFTVSAAFAQAPAVKEKLVDFKDIKIAVQKTPDFSLKGGTTDKRVRPKDWIEIEPEFRTAAPKGASKDTKVVADLVFKYYVFLGAAGAPNENKRILTGEVTHTNVPISEWTHSVVYVSPSTIMRVTGKPEGTAQLVTGYGVEVTTGGDLVGFYSNLNGKTFPSPSTAGAKWWESATVKKEEDLLNKAQSPFAPLWADYYADIKGVK